MSDLIRTAGKARHEIGTPRPSHLAAARLLDRLDPDTQREAVRAVLDICAAIGEDDAAGVATVAVSAYVLDSAAVATLEDVNGYPLALDYGPPSVDARGVLVDRLGYGDTRRSLVLRAARAAVAWARRQTKLASLADAEPYGDLVVADVLAETADPLPSQRYGTSGADTPWNIGRADVLATVLGMLDRDGRTEHVETLRRVLDAERAHRDGCDRCHGIGRAVTVPGMLAHAAGLRDTDAAYHAARRRTVAALRAAPTFTDVCAALGDPAPYSTRPKPSTAARLRQRVTGSTKTVRVNGETVSNAHPAELTARVVTGTETVETSRTVRTVARNGETDPCAVARWAGLGTAYARALDAAREHYAARVGIRPWIGDKGVTVAPWSPLDVLGYPAALDYAEPHETARALDAARTAVETADAALVAAMRVETVETVTRTAERPTFRAVTVPGPGPVTVRTRDGETVTRDLTDAERETVETVTEREHRYAGEEYGVSTAGHVYETAERASTAAKRAKGADRHALGYVATGTSRLIPGDVVPSRKPAVSPRKRSGSGSTGPTVPVTLR